MALLKITSSLVLLGLLLFLASVSAKKATPRYVEENVFLEPVDEDLARSLTSLISIEPKPEKETNIEVKPIFIPYPTGGYRDHHHDNGHHHHPYPQNPYYHGYPGFPTYPGYPGHSGYPHFPPHYHYYPMSPPVHHHHPPHYTDNHGHGHDHGHDHHHHHHHSHSKPHGDDDDEHQHHHYPHGHRPHHYPHHHYSRPNIYSYPHNQHGYFSNTPSFVVINPSNISPVRQIVGSTPLDIPIVGKGSIDDAAEVVSGKSSETEDNGDGRSYLDAESSFIEPQEGDVVEYDDVVPVEEDNFNGAHIVQSRGNLLQTIMKPNRRKGVQERFAQIYLRNYNSKK